MSGRGEGGGCKAQGGVVQQIGPVLSQKPPRGGGADAASQICVRREGGGGGAPRGGEGVSGHPGAVAAAGASGPGPGWRARGAVRSLGGGARGQDGQCGLCTEAVVSAGVERPDRVRVRRLGGSHALRVRPLDVVLPLLPVAGDRRRVPARPAASVTARGKSAAHASPRRGTAAARAPRARRGAGAAPSVVADPLRLARVADFVLAILWLHVILCEPARRRTSSRRPVGEHASRAVSSAPPERKTERSMRCLAALFARSR